MKMNIIYDGEELSMHMINNGTIEEFIEFAKSYNIFQESNSKAYTRVCDLIKARLDREGLSHETVRPE